jgi:hypothetical protein
MDNADEFSSKDFNDYCMPLRINVEHSIPYVHTQNGLAGSLIKRVQDHYYRIANNQHLIRVMRSYTP